VRETAKKWKLLTAVLARLSSPAAAVHWLTVDSQMLPTITVMMTYILNDETFY